MRYLWLSVLVLTLGLGACGEEEKKKRSGSSSASSDEESADAKSNAKSLEEDNPETPEFTKEDSDELREEKYGNSQNKAQGYVRRDANDNYVRVGPWKFWYRKGAMKESGSYVGGKKQGRWEAWHSN